MVIWGLGFRFDGVESCIWFKQQSPFCVLMCRHLGSEPKTPNPEASALPGDPKTYSFRGYTL